MDNVTHLNDNGVSLRCRAAESAAVRWERRIGAEMLSVKLWPLGRC